MGATAGVFIYKLGPYRGPCFYTQTHTHARMNVIFDFELFNFSTQDSAEVNTAEFSLSLSLSEGMLNLISPAVCVHTIPICCVCVCVLYVCKVYTHTLNTLMLLWFAFWTFTSSSSELLLL